jgi:hypothetical protein
MHQVEIQISIWTPDIKDEQASTDFSRLKFSVDSILDVSAVAPELMLKFGSAVGFHAKC